MAELEDKYSRFKRYTNIDLKAEIAAGGSEGGLEDYYTKTETNGLLANKADNDDLSSLDARVTDLEENPVGVTDHGALTGLADDDHTQYHNDTRGDIRYYTKSQVDTSLAGKANTAHNHAATDINSGTLNIARIPTGSTSSTVSLGDHNHDSRYYTETEVDNLLNSKADTADLADYTLISDTPRYLMFNVTWPARPSDSRMTFYIGGDPDTDAPSDSITGDVWIPIP